MYIYIYIYICIYIYMYPRSVSYCIHRENTRYRRIILDIEIMLDLEILLQTTHREIILQITHREIILHKERSHPNSVSYCIRRDYTAYTEIILDTER